MSTSKNELKLTIEKTQKVIQSYGYKKMCESYDFNNVIHYKAVFMKRNPVSYKEEKIHVDLYNNGTLMLQGDIKKEFKSELKTHIKDEINGNTQLELFSKK